jgi:hypothetical protein
LGFGKREEYKRLSEPKKNQKKIKIQNVREKKI